MQTVASATRPWGLSRYFPGTLTFLRKRIVMIWLLTVAHYRTITFPYIPKHMSNCTRG